MCKQIALSIPQIPWEVDATSHAQMLEEHGYVKTFPSAEETAQETLSGPRSYSVSQTKTSRTGLAETVESIPKFLSDMVLLSSMEMPQAGGLCSTGLS